MTQDQYKILFKHIFNWPNRQMCIKEWKRLYFTAPFYAEGIEHINTFFNSVLRSEFNRLRDPNAKLYPTGEFKYTPEGSDSDIDKAPRYPTER